MAPIVPAVARELANGARDALRQGAAVATGSQGDYIKSGEPESIYGKIQQETARQACRRYADDPGKFSGGGKVLVENSCRPYLDDIGYGSPGSAKKPFEGGQCQTFYGLSGNVEFTTFVGALGQTFNSVIDVTGGADLSGPVTGFSFRYDTPGSAGNRRWIMDVATSVGLVQGYRTFLNPDSNSSVSAASFAGSLVRGDGQPDDCGNPPPDIVDPTPPPGGPGPAVEPFNPSPDIDIDIGVEINPDGSIDVDFGTGPINIDPFGGSEGGGGGAAGPGPGDVGEPGSPGDTGQGGDTDGEAPPGTVLTGLKINFLTPPVGGNEYKEGIFRGVCYIYMGTADGVDHDPAGAMLRDGQFVFAEKDNLTNWFVSANQGYNLRVTPYYRPVEEEEG